MIGRRPPAGQKDQVPHAGIHGPREHLVLIFSAMPQPTQNPVTSFYDSFAEYKPERPTALLLKRIEGGEYKRVRKR